jgi:hypothetical protein
MSTSPASAAAPGLVAPANLPRLPVPRSNVTIEIVTSLAESRIHDYGPVVSVRCKACDHRLFDVQAEHAGSRFLAVTRVCPKCRRQNTGCVTQSPGRPLTEPDDLKGSWLCESGQWLGYVDAVRGRITVYCRHCKDHETNDKRKVRVIAADAIAVAYRVVD